MYLRSLLRGKLPEEKLCLVPRGFEVIGDIAIINIPSFLEDEKYLIAETIVSHRKDINVVLRKTKKIHGNHRVGGFELLIGNRTSTYHKENNCIFYVDITKTYFSSRMGYEHNRIAQKAVDGEHVLVLFCGVGTFLIPIKKNKNVSIVGLDNNPLACKYLRKNLELNNVHAEVILGDANFINMFKKSFDRIVMPTPYGKDHFLMLAQYVLKPEGMVHFYTFKKDAELLYFKRLLEKKGWDILFYRECGSIAPRVKRYVFELKKSNAVL